MLIKIGKDKKPSRGLFDFLRNKKPEHVEGSALLIDWSATNVMDAIFVAYYQKHGVHLQPRKLFGWWCIGKHEGKLVMGNIVDIYPTRDVLVKEHKDDAIGTVIPFEHVVDLHPSKP